MYHWIIERCCSTIALLTFNWTVMYLDTFLCPRYYISISMCWTSIINDKLNKQFVWTIYLTHTIVKSFSLVYCILKHHCTLLLLLWLIWLFNSKCLIVNKRSKEQFKIIIKFYVLSFTEENEWIHSVISMTSFDTTTS